MQNPPQDNSDDDDPEYDLQSAAEQEVAEKGGRNQERQLRDRKLIKPPSRYRDACISFVDYKEPEEAITGSDADKWKEAMSNEINSLNKNQTWSLVNLPHDQQVIDNHWIYKVKQSCDSSVKRFKTRLVARGFKQIAGVDYHIQSSNEIRLNLNYSICCSF